MQMGNKLTNTESKSFANWTRVRDCTSKKLCNFLTYISLCLCERVIGVGLLMKMIHYANDGITDVSLLLRWISLCANFRCQATHRAVVKATMLKTTSAYYLFSNLPIIRRFLVNILLSIFLKLLFLTSVMRNH